MKKWYHDSWKEIMNMCCIKNKLEIPPKKGIPVEISTSLMDHSQMASRKSSKSLKTSCRGCWTGTC